MKMRLLVRILVAAALVPEAYAAQKEAATLDEFLAQARTVNPMPANSPSLFSPTAPNLFLFRDVKARNVNDIITIQIIENATATNSANTSTEKGGDVNLGMPGLFGLEGRTSALNFARLLDGSSSLNFTGTGSTSRSGVLQAWLTARVVEVLPNGDLVIEGTKDVTINRERQSLSVRGVVRPRDLTANNIVLSTAVAHMEVKFDGKGIVTNANKPGFMHWLFNKILPF
jgi:flagellar L-ring protein precursor FlgH